MRSLFGGVAPLSHRSSVRDLGCHTTPGTSYYLPTNHWHAIYLCAHSSAIASSPRSPRTSK